MNHVSNFSESPSSTLNPSSPSTARLIDGKAAAADVRARVAQRTVELARRAVVPGLVVVLVGDDPASHVYVRNKDKAAREVGFAVRTIRLPANTDQISLTREIESLNRDPAVHGILVQLPLPRGLDAGAIVRAIDPRKDVDGLHPENVAALVLGTPGLFPCTPLGCIELCGIAGVELSGRHVVVVGRSMLVGKPFALMALQRDATVTICHSKTRDLAQVCRSADVLVAAVGRPEMIRGDWVRPGATVLDVGINRTAQGTLVGDVAFTEVLAHAGAVTPVPGGVGPMTIAMLLANTATAAERSLGRVDGSAAASLGD